ELAREGRMAVATTGHERQEEHRAGSRDYVPAGDVGRHRKARAAEQENPVNKCRKKSKGQAEKRGDPRGNGANQNQTTNHLAWLDRLTKRSAGDRADIRRT